MRCGLVRFSKAAFLLGLIVLSGGPAQAARSQRGCAARTKAAKRLLTGAVKHGHYSPKVLQALLNDGVQLDTSGLPKHSGLEQYKKVLEELIDAGVVQKAVIAHVKVLLRKSQRAERTREQAKQAQEVIVGDLDFGKGKVVVWPENLTHVRGHVKLRGSKLTKLPPKLTRIDGYLDLYGSEVRELPAGLAYIGEYLDLNSSQVRELPASLTHVGGYLSLGSQVRELPAGLTYIGGGLYLGKSQVRELPAGLTYIGGDLDLRGSQIRKLPANISTIVKGRILR